MNIRLQLPKITDLQPRLAVIGVGGAGGNAVNNMIASGLAGVNFIVANTDAQALAASSAEQRIQLGVNLTEGLGAGAKPEIGEAAAEEALDEIRSQISGSHMVFIAAGMGGGTGTGAATVIARVARELGILTVGVVTKPFQFEGSRRMRIAEAGIAELRKYVDTLIVIPNQNLFRIANEKTTFAEAFVLADQVLYSGIACIVDLIVKEGLINLDFADVRAIMSGMGTAMMGTGEASGERRAILAAEEAIANPLLDDISLRGAKGLLLSIIGGRDLTLYEVDEAASRVRQEVDADANIIVGATFDESLADRIRVSIVASGMTGRQEPKAGSAAASAHPQPHQGVQQTSHAHHPRAPAPAGRPAAGATSRPPGPADFMQELTRAIQDEPNSPERRPGELWPAPGGVFIEEGLPPLSPAVPAATSVRIQGSAEPFTPAAPVEIKRAQRRMPSVEDFPAVGQREYRAKMAYHDAGSGPQQVRRAPVPLTEAPQKKEGLLSRLARFGRRAELTSGSPSADPKAPAFTPAGRGPAGEAAGPQSARSERPRPLPAQSSEEVELPMFFQRDRNRS